MKAKIIVEKTVIEEHIIDMDEKFRQCACPFEELNKVPFKLFAEAADEASRILGIPLKEEGGLYALEVITGGYCVDNNEPIFET